MYTWYIHTGIASALDRALSCHTYTIENPVLDCNGECCECACAFVLCVCVCVHVCVCVGMCAYACVCVHVCLWAYVCMLKSHMIKHRLNIHKETHCHLYLVTSRSYQFLCIHIHNSIQFYPHV